MPPPPHAALSAVTETSEGSAGGRRQVRTVRKMHVTEDRTRLTQALEIEIAAEVFSFSNPIPCVLLVPTDREAKRWKM